MKNYFLFLSVMLIGTLTYGQSITNNSLNSASSDFRNNEYTMNWSIGEIIVTGTNKLFSGINATTTLSNTNINTLSVTKSSGKGFVLFPNPTSQDIFINRINRDKSNYSYQIFSMTGLLIEEGNLYANVTRIPLSILMFVTNYSRAQNQDAFNFQAIIRNESGEVLQTQELRIKFEILENNPNGEIVFTQESGITTNEFGLITAQIGNETSTNVSLSDISWADNSYFLRINVDFDGSGTYEEMSTTQLVSVPFAMYAKKAGNTYWENSGDDNIYFIKGFVGLGDTTATNILSISLSETGNEQDKGFSLNRNSGYLDLINGTNYDTHFQARISAKSTHEDSPGLIVAATPAFDEIDGKGILLRAGEEAPLRNANVLSIENYTNSLITVKPDGKTGIGTENPNYRLDVNGDLNASNLYINGQEIQANLWSENQNGINFDSGFVGIGSNLPTNLFSISLPETGNEQNTGFSLNRNSGYLNLINGTAYDTHFQARISAKSTHEDSPGLTVAATPAFDEIDGKGIILRAGEEAPLQNANVLSVENYTNSLITVKPDGKTGIGTSQPKSKLQVTDGDIYIEDAASGVIMTSPDGNCWRMTVDNTGNPQFTSITCPQ